MNINIAIADSNETYLKRLMDVLDAEKSLTISIFTDEEGLIKALEDRDYDVLLFDPDISDRKLNFYRTKLPICLYSPYSKNHGLYSGIQSIKKYQRISNIYADVNRLYAEKAGDVFSPDKSSMTSVISVFSPVGGSGKTSVAMAIASKLKEEGEVLFLSMEQLCGVDSLNPPQDEGIVKLIENLKEDVNFEALLAGMRKHGFNDIYYISGFDKAVDYNEVSREDVRNLIVAIKKTGVFKYVVIDTESIIDERVMAILEGSDHIVVVSSSDDTSAEKIKKLPSQAVIMENSKKISMIFNKKKTHVKSQSDYEWDVIGEVKDYGNIYMRDVVKNMYIGDEINVETLK